MPACKVESHSNASDTSNAFVNSKVSSASTSIADVGQKVICVRGSGAKREMYFFSVNVLTSPYS